MAAHGRARQPQLVGHAAHALIDAIETPRRCACTKQGDDLPPDPTPLSTGMPAIDGFLGGGLRRGALTIVESDDNFVLDAIAFSVARSVTTPALLVHPSLHEAISWITAGEADISVAGLLTGRGITADEISDMRFATQRLDELPLTLAEASDADTVIGHMLAGVGHHEIVVVAAVHRYVQPRQLLVMLAELALQENLAVLVTNRSLGNELTGGLEADLVVATVGPIPGTAILIRPDDDELLSVCELETDLFTGRIRPRAPTTP